MIETLLEILIANGAVLIVPGLNFSLISRISMHRGIQSGVITSFGITLAIMVHVIVGMMGSYKLFNKFPLVFNCVKWTGVAYILWLSLRLIWEAFNPHKVAITKKDKIGSNLDCFRNGFLVDLLNPYVTIFYVSLFSQIMKKDVNLFSLSVYGGFIFFLTLLWFILVACVFSRPLLRTLFQTYKKIIELISAGLLIYFAMKLAFS